MGNRNFYDQMLQDAMFQRKYKITDEIDVTTLKDYMQVRLTVLFTLCKNTVMHVIIQIT